LKPWDTAAGIVIVQEAGGVISDYYGRPFHINSDSILAGNKPLHAQLLKTIKGVQ
jgi:myo-inositol-1(or 4)-monophosphatase